MHFKVIVNITFVLQYKLDVNQIMIILYGCRLVFMEICFDVIKHVSIFAE